MKKWVACITVAAVLLAQAVVQTPAVKAESGFTSSKSLTVDDLTVSNFATGRKVVTPFGYTSGIQDVEYVPTVGTAPVGRFFTVLNGKTIKSSKVVNGKLEYESEFLFKDDRSGAIPGSNGDAYPKTSFSHTSGISYKDIGGVPYVFIHESWGNSNPKYKDEVLYKCRIDYANKLLRIEGAMVVASSASGWPVAQDGKPFNTVQEISGGDIVGDWMYSIEWSYSTSDTPTTHVFKTNINDCTNPGTLRPRHVQYATTSVNELPFMLNQGIKNVNGRWFITRNPNGSGLYEIKIKEDTAGNITGVDYVGQIAGERNLEEEGIAAYEGDIIYFYNNFLEKYPAYRVALTAKLRKERIEVPVTRFVGAQDDYDDVRVYQGNTEIPRVITGGKLVFLADNSGQAPTNPFPKYTVKYGNAALPAPSYPAADISAINSSAVTGSVTASLTETFGYTDDFSKNTTLSQYKVYDLGDNSGPSNWSISGGTLNQGSNLHGPLDKGVSYPNERGTHLILDREYDGDWDLSVKVKATDDDGIGLVFGQQDSANFYALEWDKQYAGLAFWKSVNQANTGTVIAEADGYGYSTNTWYTLMVQKRGNAYSFYVNGVLKLQGADAAFPAGRVGLLSRGSTGLSFDDFSITPIGASYADDFSADTMGRYSPVDMGDLARPSAWSIGGGVMNQTSNIYGPILKGDSYPNERGTHLLLNQTYAGDWDVSVRVKAADNDGVGLVFGQQDSTNFYALEWDSQNARMGFWKSVNQTNTGTVITEAANYAYTLNTWYTLKAEKRGATYNFYVDDVLKLTASDPTFASGKLGLLSRGSTGLMFDDLKVVSL
jgi:hypothetical protein